MRAHRTLRLLAALGLGLASVGAAAAVTPASAAGTAEVSVFHGIPGQTVDVYANGDRLLNDFTPGKLAGPVTLPAAGYDLAVFPAGQGPQGDPLIEAQDVKVPAGANVTVVAHLDADGGPVLTPFVNDTSTVPAGQARLTVRHTAAASAVDVRANGQPAFRGLTNPNEASAVLPAGTITADVALAGTDTVALGPAQLPLAEGTHTIVYAWGSAERNTLALATQTIRELQTAPSGVPSGTGGFADGGLPVIVVALAGVAAIGGLFAVAQARRQRRAAVPVPDRR